ncbi:hypothetical protein Tco_0237019 [Tanacetum coccineum]
MRSSGTLIDFGVANLSNPRILMQRPFITWKESGKPTLKKSLDRERSIAQPLERNKVNEDLGKSLEEIL